MPDAAKKGLLALLSLSGARLTSAQSSGRPGHGLVGYPIIMYQPECAHACRSALPRSSIPCDIHLNGHHSSTVSAECLALSEPFLFSAAWCIYTHCPDENVAVSTLETFWETELVGRELNQPKPKYTYQESLALVKNDPPTTILPKRAAFNRTTLVSDESYTAAWNGNTAFEYTEINHQKLSLIVLVTGAGIPILLSLLRFIPFPATLVDQFHGYIIEPPLFGGRHASPILGLGLVPTRGQSLFILYLIAINVIFVAIGYKPRQPNSWWEHGLWEEILNYVANRTGMLSFANLPLLILYAGRNNVLLWLTSWSYSTFLLIHRWVAILCVLQAAIHSALWLHIHVGISQDHSEVAAIPYWYWGIIATLALVLILPFSLLPVRQRMYEFFHAAHIVLAILSIVGCWYHIIYRYKRQWGYENWVIMASVIWACDWVLRAVRMAGNGVKRGYVTKLGDEYIRLDVPGLNCPGHAYMYFPTLTWRVWESHPFSAIGVSQLTGLETCSSHVQVPEPKVIDSEKAIGLTSVVTAGETSSSTSPQEGDLVAHTTKIGVSFFIRVDNGTTSLLAAHAGKPEGISLVAECYNHQSVLRHDLHGGPTSSHPNLVVIAGGVGITAVLPKLAASRALFKKPVGRRTLYWGLRDEGLWLFKAVEDMIGGCEQHKGEPKEGKGDRQNHNQTERKWGDVDVHIGVGERFDFRAVIEAELATTHGQGGTVILVCGPRGMADEVRMVVTAHKRKGVAVRLVEDSFSW
uniref:Ferric oxidoreductase domain-containing protein n=1 Tax=Bionectria ochroleuca TaxID=29856 RepID=A0A0B7K638_BIOOC